jgi:hypothetical protein
VLDAAGRRVWEKPIHLLMDCYKVHLDRQIRADADSMFQIQFHFIPAGLTDEWQPLDRAVFAVVKAISRRLYREEMALQMFERVNKRMLLEAWSRVSHATYRRAWRCYDLIEDEKVA